MRPYFILIFICAFAQFCNAQNVATDLKFDQKLYNCEKRWVVMPPKDGQTRYAYGYVYMDETAGLTFDLRGAFTVDQNNHYLVDTPKMRTQFYKYRITPQIAMGALVPENHFAELNLEKIPGWVNIYYHGYTDTLRHNFQMGYNYNAAGGCQIALTYLEPLYKKKPEYPGLIFELAYAYNDLNQTDKAITLVSEALKKDTKNARLYRELGYSYMRKKDSQHAISAYTQGIDIAQSNDDKSEMAYNLAMVYKNDGKTDDYKTWMTKAKSFTTPNSRLYNAIVSQGF